MKRNLNKLIKLSDLLSKYKHRYNDGNCSQRIEKWIDAYNDIKENDKETWVKFCDLKGYAYEHDAYDSFS